MKIEKKLINLIDPIFHPFYAYIHASITGNLIEPDIEIDDNAAYSASIESNNYDD